MSARDIERLGQVFTPPKVVEFMLDLCGNSGRALEPSAGDGAFFAELKQRRSDCVGIEIDPEFFEAACHRIEEAQHQAKLFPWEAI